MNPACMRRSSISASVRFSAFMSTIDANCGENKVFSTPDKTNGKEKPFQNQGGYYVHSTKVTVQEFD